MSTEEKNTSQIKENIAQYTTSFPAEYEYQTRLIYNMPKNQTNDQIVRLTYINHILVLLLLTRIEAKKYNLQLNQYNESKKFHGELIDVIKDLSDTLKFASIRGPEYIIAKKSFEDAANISDSLD
jgi:hypothetical protein